MATEIDYSLPVTTLNGEETDLRAFEGKVLLIVNTASQCGFTPQYAGLEALYQEFRDAGLEVLGFPCNQFGNQEPGGSDEIQSFCQLNYDVTLPMFARVDVNGKNAHPLFDLLKAGAPGLLGSQSIKWNFTKFLVDRNGDVVGRFAPNDAPESLAEPIKALL